MHIAEERTTKLEDKATEILQIEIKKKGGGRKKPRTKHPRPKGNVE